MGKTTLEELQMRFYEKDSTANAVYLYEHANVYLDSDNKYKTRTDYYFRIKIFKKEAYEYANQVITIAKKEKVTDIEGITYNIVNGGMQKTSLSKKNVFSTDLPNNRVQVKFTLPNLKEGCVIEFKYSVISPYLGLDDWVFQDKIPKIESEYDAAILGNYKYNIRTVGYHPLSKNEGYVKRKCIYIEGLGDGDCAIYSFAMKNIPSFKEEDYMLSKKNYMSRLTFDLISYTSPRGPVTKYTDTWKNVDKKLKSLYFNNQTSKTSFFKKNLPQALLTEENEMEKAMGIYKYIQNRYTWNGKYWNINEKVKKAFESKSGSAGEINLSLYNSLKAANLKADLVILATRNFGLPTKLFPVIRDFNYVIVKVTIGEKYYYLDATDNLLPFGMVPFRCLNGDVRVISFKKESNWQPITSQHRSLLSVRTKLVLNSDGVFTGKIDVIKQGYVALNSRKEILGSTEEEYLAAFENQDADLEVESYKNENLNDVDLPLKESYSIVLDSEEAIFNKARINPFFVGRTSTNPFKLEKRNYPVDFGYPKTFNYVTSLEIPKGFKVMSLPKNTAIALPNGGGIFSMKVVQKENIINLYTRFNIRKRTFSSKEYFALKEFYNQIIKAESSYIVIEKAY
ncbi:MAG: hypothetical protein CMB99_13925 [Flavobacteriaceae bacterium]|nr:hypothetical protein [Flavobacteriaceae bacterium]